MTTKVESKSHESNEPASVVEPISTGEPVDLTFIGQRRPGADRPTTEPGGMECEGCGCIFIGAEWHSYCAHCEKERSNADAPSEPKSERSEDKPNEKSATVRAFAVFGPDGKVWIETVQHNERNAWIVADNESYTRPAKLKAQGYTCREVLITEAPKGDV